MTVSSAFDSVGLESVQRNMRTAAPSAVLQTAITKVGDGKTKSWENHKLSVVCHLTNLV